MLDFGRKLRGYLAENSIIKKDFAIEIGVSAETVSNWLHRGKRPNRLHAMAIDNYTNGLIDMEDMGY